MVSTISSPSACARSTAPRWPSCSRQSRGHRSHCMRPSSQRVPPAAGYRRAVMVVVRPLGDPVARDLAARRGAMSARQARLAASARAGTARLSGMLSQTCGRKVRALAVGFEDQAVVAGHDLREQVGLVGEAHRLGRARAATPRRGTAAIPRASAAGSADRGTPRRARSAPRPRRAGAPPRGCRCSRAARRRCVSVTKVAPGCCSQGRSMRSVALRSPSSRFAIAARAIASSARAGRRRSDASPPS